MGGEHKNPKPPPPCPGVGSIRKAPGVCDEAARGGLDVSMFDRLIAEGLQPSGPPPFNATIIVRDERIMEIRTKIEK